MKIIEALGCTREWFLFVLFSELGFFGGIACLALWLGGRKSTDRK